MYTQIKQNKYKNKVKEYNGIRYQSTKEANYAMELDLRVKGKDIKGWKGQVKIPFKIRLEDMLNVIGDNKRLPILTSIDGLELKKKGCQFFHITNYYMDFEIEHNDESFEFIEVKGLETSTWKLKWKMLKAVLPIEYPDHIMTLVK